jgi:hypothetical protein
MLTSSDSLPEKMKNPARSAAPAGRRKAAKKKC